MNQFTPTSQDKPLAYCYAVLFVIMIIFGAYALGRETSNRQWTKKAFKNGWMIQNEKTGEPLEIPAAK